MTSTTNPQAPVDGEGLKAGPIRILHDLIERASVDQSINLTQATGRELLGLLMAPATQSGTGEGEAVDPRFPKGRPQRGCYCSTRCVAPRIMGSQTPCLRLPVPLTPGQTIGEGQ